MGSQVGLAMLGVTFLFAAPACFAESAPEAPPPVPPLSEAQTALFATPHLANVTRPETLEYKFQQLGPGGFTDRVNVTVAEIHQDGSKDLRFDFLSGEHHVTYPGIAHFTGNPLLMLFLEYDVRQMREQTGMSAAHFRDEIRQAFLDGATVTEGNLTIDGQSVPARTIVLQPYAHDPQFGRIKVIAGKTYTFVVSANVPGGIATVRADAPADPAVGAPPLGNSVDFVAAHP